MPEGSFPWTETIPGLLPDGPAHRIAPHGRVPGRHAALALLLAIGTACTMDMSIISALLTPIKAGLHLNDENFGRIAASFTLAGLVGLPLFSALAARFGRKPVLVAAIAVWSLASAGGALSAGLASLLLWRALTGFGEAAYQGLAPSWLADLYTREHRNFVFSLFMIRNKLGAALAFGLGGWLAARYDWHSAFIWTGLPGVALALLLLLVREPVAGASDPAPLARRPLPWRAQLAVLRIPAYLTHIVALAFFYSGMLTAQFWLPAYLHRVYGLTNQAATGFLSLVLLATAPCGLIGGYLVGRWLTARGGGLAAALAVSSLLAGVLFAVAFTTRDLTTCKVLAVLGIICFGSTAGTLTTLTVDTVPPELRIVAGSIGAFVVALVSGVIVPWMLGALSDRYGLSHAIYIGAVCYLVSGLIWAASARSGARTQPSTAQASA